MKKVYEFSADEVRDALLASLLEDGKISISEYNLNDNDLIVNIINDNIESIGVEINED